MHKYSMSLLLLRLLHLTPLRDEHICEQRLYIESIFTE